MWPAWLLQDFDGGGDWWRVLAWVALLVGSALSYQRYQYRRHPILDDPSVTRGLTREQRLRLELGLIDTAPEYSDDPLQPVLVEDRRAINAAIREAIEDSRQRERGHLSHLKPAELARLRMRMDSVLRTRWEDLANALLTLRADAEGAGWADAVAGEAGIANQVADLDAELRAAKQQPTYPTIALQLEGPLLILREVVGHALQTLEPDCDPVDAEKLRQSVLRFVGERLPEICINVRETEPEQQPELDPAVRREVVLGNELTSQDLPSN